ncbi:MAG: amidohydrolase [Clostridia bacterium]|nr:amidohydrolase [Clostridia bacterium]
MNTLTIERATALRAKLHEIPELSLNEDRTRKAIKDFLSEYNLEVHEHGKAIYAVSKGTEAKQNTAFRADFDAVAGADGTPGHYCGHDGHTAILCAFAAYVSEHEHRDNIYFIFQPAEETGEGAVLCTDILRENNIDKIYGFHNIPGYALGSVLTRDGTFACASTGLEISFTGAPSHAAYPELGANPCTAISELIVYMNGLLNAPHRGMLLGTVIGIDAGSESYGVSASSGKLCLTLRGEYQEEFENLVNSVSNRARELAKRDNLKVSLAEKERFPSTENHSENVKEIIFAAEKAGLTHIVLENPFRWSEDFGYYLKETDGAFFGIGDGENHPGLHTADYCFPDGIIESVLRVYEGIVYL